MTRFMKKNVWNSKRIILTIALSTIIFSLSAQESSPAHIGIVYPLSTHGTKATNYSNIISIHALAGLSGGEQAFALYGLAGIVKGNVTGLQASGVFNKTTGTLRGMQLAGAINLADDASEGYQFAGLFNQSKKNVHVQLSGLLNKAVSTTGLQAGGISSISTELTGVQLSGLYNQSGDVRGAQIGGVINKAKHVKGVQFGLLNIADSSDYTIGLLNFVKNGEQSIRMSTDENLSTFVSFRSGGRVLYGILGIGFNPQYEAVRYGAEGGIGVNLLNRDHFRLATEISSTTLTDFDGHYFNKNGLRILPSIKIGRNIYLYGGPSFNYINTDNEDGKKLVKMKVWDKQNSKDYQALNIGFTGGLQLIL